MSVVTCEVWQASLADLKAAHIAWVSELERDRAGRFVKPNDRTRSLLGAALLRAVAARHLDVAPTDVIVDRTCSRCGAAHGRPNIAGGPSVSLSHSGNLVVVATTTVLPIGVDVEAIVDSDLADVADAAFTAQERSDLSSPTDVLVCWTRKEAFLKATGEGLTVPLTDLRVSPPHCHAALLERVGVATPRCAMRDLDPWPGHVGTVAVLGADEVQVIEMDGAEVLATSTRFRSIHPCVSAD